MDVGDANSDSHVLLSSEESDESVSDGEVANPAALLDEHSRAKVGPSGIL